MYALNAGTSDTLISKLIFIIVYNFKIEIHKTTLVYLITCRHRHETTSRGRDRWNDSDVAMLLMQPSTLHCRVGSQICFAIRKIICSIQSLCLILQRRLTAVAAVQRETKKIRGVCASREAFTNTVDNEFFHLLC